MDAFAARRDLYIDSMPLAKEIAAALVEDKKVGICSAFPVLGTVPAELTQVENCLLYTSRIKRCRNMCWM